MDVFVDAVNEASIMNVGSGEPENRLCDIGSHNGLDIANSDGSNPVQILGGNGSISQRILNGPRMAHELPSSLRIGVVAVIL